MSPVAVEHQLRQLRLAATTAHVIPPIALDLVGGDGRVRRVGSTADARPDLLTCQFRALVAEMRATPTIGTMTDLLDFDVEAPIDVRVHVGCRHVRDLGGGVYVLHGRDKTRLVFMTLLDGERAREVTRAVSRPDRPGDECPALASLSALSAVGVMVDELTGVTVVYCDQLHPAGLPILEVYGQALFSACTVAELLDGVG
jgi:hypothetical protein